MSQALGDREQAFENKFKHDEELKFKVGARRAKLAGLWIAEVLGLSGQDAQDYAKTMVTADMEKPGHEDLLAKIKSDLENRGIVMAEREVLKKLEELEGIAKKQIMEGK